MRLRRERGDNAGQQLTGGAATTSDLTGSGGRDCGACTACCQHLAIESADFQKPAGPLCAPCNGHGCRIYDARPQICRDYYCGWQQIPLLDEGWRPDKSGVLLLPVKKTSGMPQGMEFMIRGRAAAVRRPGFAEFVAFLISKGAAVFLSVAGRRAQLNGSLREAVAARNMEAVRQLLLRLHAGPPRTEIGMCRRRCSNRLLNRVGFQRRHVRVVLVDHQIAAE